MDLFLPDLFYCDRKQTIDLLSILVNDLVTEYSLRQQVDDSGSQGIEASLSSNIGKIVARYQVGNSRSVEKEGIVKLPTASLFADLYSILKSKHKIQSLVGFDEDILSQLKLGEFIELEGTFNQSPVELMFSSIIDFVKKFKDFFLGQPGTDQIVLLANLLEQNKATLIIKPYSDVQATFISSIMLSEENLMTERYEIEGEFTIFGRIRRITPIGQRVDLFKFLPGKLNIQHNQLKEMLTKFGDLEQKGVTFGNLSNIDEKSFYLEGPVYELNPIGIYQNY